VVVAAANLDKALERCPRRLRAVLQISSNETRALRLLRNIYEHWDEVRDPYRREGELRASAKKLHDESRARIRGRSSWIPTQTKSPWRRSSRCGHSRKSCDGLRRVFYAPSGLTIGRPPGRHRTRELTLIPSTSQKEAKSSSRFFGARRRSGRAWA